VFEVRGATAYVYEVPELSAGRDVTREEGP